MIRGHTQAHRQQGDLIGLLLFFQNNESRQQIWKYLPSMLHSVMKIAYYLLAMLLLTEQGDRCLFNREQPLFIGRRPTQNPVE
jgi:hypothetical protein